MPICFISASFEQY